MRSAAALCLLLAGLLAIPSIATAQEKGVIVDSDLVDPDSPAGREYALPLEAARRDAAADPAARGPRLSLGAQTAPFFGVGIDPRGRDGSGGRRGDDDGRAAGGGTGSESRDEGTAGAARNAGTAAAGVVQSDFTTSITIFGLSLIVLASGAFLGLVIGRSPRRYPDA